MSGDDAAEASALFQGIRIATDQLEARLAMETRHPGRELRQTARYQGTKSSHAAAPRLTPRLEEIRQRVR